MNEIEEFAANHYTDLVIMQYLGYELVSVGYIGTEEETEWQKMHESWLNKVDCYTIGCYFANVAEDAIVALDVFTLDWSYLMVALGKLQKEHNMPIIIPDLHQMKKRVLDRLA